MSIYSFHLVYETVDCLSARNHRVPTGALPDFSTYLGISLSMFRRTEFSSEGQWLNRGRLPLKGPKR